MSDNISDEKDTHSRRGRNTRHDEIQLIYKRTPKPLPNYTLSTICPSCGSETYKLACKVRCAKCGFMWDCSEL